MACRCEGKDFDTIYNCVDYGCPVNIEFRKRVRDIKIKKLLAEWERKRQEEFKKHQDNKIYDESFINQNPDELPLYSLLKFWYDGGTVRNLLTKIADDIDKCKDEEDYER